MTEVVALSKGVTVWLTGLSGSGKTTISDIVQAELKNLNLKAEALDGDIIRRHISRDFGFSKDDRFRNVEYAAFVAKLLNQNDIIVLASFITPYQDMRDFCRQQINNFIEVYVKCSLEECIRRDVKGLYQKALSGEISNFTGISDPFEEPVHPELVIETDNETPEQSAGKIMDYLTKNKYV